MEISRAPVDVRKMKRSYVPALCKYCKRIHFISHVTISYICPYCKKYNNSQEAIKVA